jgi:hypothetical protein
MRGRLLALLACLVAAIARADDPAAPDEPPAPPTAHVPAIEVSPPALQLGTGRTARILVRTAGEWPAIATSAGTIEALREEGPGRFSASLVPPKESHPQIALVSVLAGGGAAFAPVPLAGRGVAVVRTEPLARIRVRIRDRSFGPVAADGAGVALVPVEVPPGEPFAYHRERPLDLRLPPVRRVQVVLAEARAPAERDASVAVFAVAATPDGAAWSGAPISLSAAAGAFDPVREVAPGLYASTWRLPAGAAGNVDVVLRAGEDAGESRATLERLAGAPARVVLRVARDRAIAGDAPVEISAELFDAAGNPVAGDVHLQATAGDLAPVERPAPGTVRTTWRPPDRLAGAEAVLSATAGSVSDRRAIALAPAAAATVAVALDPTDLAADGVGAAEVRVEVRDRFGNPVDGAPPSLATRAGKLSAPVRAGPGAWRARYGARWAPRGGEDAIDARTGDAVATAALRLRAPPRQAGLTLRAGVLHALGGFAAGYIGAGAETWPLRLGGRLGLETSFARAVSRRSAQLVPGAPDARVDAATELWPVELTFLARHRLDPSLTALGGLGGGIVAVRSALAVPGASLVEEWGAAATAHAAAGIALEVPSLHARVRLDARAGLQADPGLRSLRGAAGIFVLAFGVTHDAL